MSSCRSASGSAWANRRTALIVSGVVATAITASAAYRYWQLKRPRELTCALVTSTDRATLSSVCEGFEAAGFDVLATAPIQIDATQVRRGFMRCIGITHDNC